MRESRQRPKRYPSPNLRNFKPSSRKTGKPPVVSFKFKEDFEDDETRMIVRDINRKEVGYVEGGRSTRDPDTFHLSMARLMPRYQRHGIGTRAAREFEKEVAGQGFKKITIEDESQSDFWEKLGYKETRRKHNLGFDTVDRVKELKQ